jgi:outer membrane protein assembly factor BamD
MSRLVSVLVLVGALVLGVACTNKKVNNPLSNVGSKQPDKVLFDRAMDALKHNRFDVARMTLQTLINTYPDSEFIARAKLAVGDSWYAEGGTAALSQAEIEYKDFETFFPNMPEAAEAQLKIANIHYQQME